MVASEQESDSSSETKAARTRRRILDAAAKVLSQKGYAGTRLSDIAKIAGIQAPPIYYHFESRDAIIEEVMWLGTAEIAERVRGALDEIPDGTPDERLFAAIDAHMRYILHLSDYATAAVRNAGQVPEAIRARQMVEETRYGELWAAIIGDLQKAGRIRSDIKPKLVRGFILGALNYATEWWDPDRGSVDAVVDTAQSFVAHGVLAPAETPVRGKARRSARHTSPR